jgi:hypothetical protein
VSCAEYLHIFFILPLHALCELSLKVYVFFISSACVITDITVRFSLGAQSELMPLYASPYTSYCANYSLTVCVVFVYDLCMRF